jgi:hypothetical protein
MTMIKSILILFILYFSCLSCFSGLENINKSSVYFGGYALLDPLDQKSAFPQKNYAILLNDSTICPIIDGKVNDTLAIKINKTNLSDDGKILKIGEFYDFYDNKINHRKGDYYFYNASMDSMKNKFSIQNTCWGNSNYRICFEDSTLQILNIENQTAIYKCFKIENIQGINFLNLYGNKWDCNPYFQFFKYQIIQKSSNSIVLRGFFDDKFNELSLKKTNNFVKSKDDFYVCNDLIYQNNPIHRYYYSAPVYNGGIYNITKTYNLKYRKPEDIKESGLIRIRFLINCKGETGRFEMIEMDNNYVIKTFHASISTQILNICKALNEWTPGRRNNVNLDSYKFLTFKIKDSEIIEIFP